MNKDILFFWVINLGIDLCLFARSLIMTSSQRSLPRRRWTLVKSSAITYTIQKLRRNHGENCAETTAKTMLKPWQNRTETVAKT